MLINEVQLGIDPRKRFTWPEYAMGSRAAHSCPVSLLVVAPDPDVAAWCAEAIETGIPGFVLRPPVLGRGSIPIVTDPIEAARRPELAVLSASRTARATWSGGRGRGPARDPRAR